MTGEDRELLKRGAAVLARELGVEGMVRFLQLLAPCEGDYTKERQALLADMSMDDVEGFLRQDETGSGNYTEERDAILADCTPEDFHEFVRKKREAAEE